MTDNAEASHDLEKESAPARPAGPTFPDGGLEAWLNIVGVFLITFTSYGQLNAFGVFQAYYAEHQLKDKSASDISWIGSLQLSLTYVSGMLLGRIFDIYGARGLLVSGWLLSTFCLMMTSLSTQYYQFMLSQGVGYGIGIALQMYPLLVVPAHWFQRKRGAAMGITVAGASLSGVVFPIMLSRLFDSIGFGWTVRTLAFFNFGVQAIAIPLVKERLPTRMSLPRIDLQAFSDRTFMLHITSGFLMAFGLYTPIWYIELYSLQEGISANISFYLISIMNAAGLIGRIATGYAGDRLGRFNVMIPIMLLSSISSFAIWSTSRSAAELIVFTVVFGFTGAAYSSLGVACTAQLTSDPTRIGARIGMFMTGMAAGILTGPSIAGAILTNSGGKYLGLQLFVGAVLSAGAVLAVVARISGAPKKWKF